MSQSDRWLEGDTDEREFVDEFALPLASLRAQMARCPPIDVLVGAESGVLPDESLRAVAAHLTTCAPCRQTLQDLRDSDLGEPAVETLASLASTVRTRIESRPPATAAAPQSRRVAYALAASMAALVALGGWGVYLQQQNRVLLAARGPAALPPMPSASGAGDAGLGNAPDPTLIADLRRTVAVEQARARALEAELARMHGAEIGATINVPILDLEPVDARRAGPASPVTLPPDATLVTVVLAAGPSSGGALFALEVRDSAGQVTWEGTGLRATASGTVSLVLHPTLLPAGNARLRLFRLNGRERTLAYEYAVRVGGP